ncbi:MAG: DNA repair protein RecN [Ignavibacteriaceae bacterium]|nr:DNA repair protein RecN [Ignavibacteriaceae bacterium]
MLQKLIVKDFALIDEAEIEFGAGLNIITGETGAGKSILLDALSLILGERASSDLIREGSGKAVIEGHFLINESSKIERFMIESELDFEGQIIVRREIQVKGTGRNFINDTPVSLIKLKELGEILVDLHGQHEHQALLKKETHIDYLDAFANCTAEKENFKREAAILNDLLDDKKSLITKKNTYSEKKEYYSFRLKEIDTVTPVLGEDQSLENELNILENSEKIILLTSSILSLLYDDNDSAYTKIFEARKSLEQLTRLDSSFNELEKELFSAITSVDETVKTVRDYVKNIDLDPGHIERLRERVAAINRLKKKFGGSIEEILKVREEMAYEMSLVDNFGLLISEIDEKIKSSSVRVEKAAKILSEKRKKAVNSLQQIIISQLENLGISNAVFNVEISKIESPPGKMVEIAGEKMTYGIDGIDDVEFFMSANQGQSAKPLIKVASGGEVSRIMLALKSALANSDSIPVLVFDEIDTGVSGRIARKVGLSLKELSKLHQIITITHLPQIAALSDFHFRVSKTEEKGRAVTKISLLNTDEKIAEVAKLISGDSITTAAIEGAKELINSTGL